MLVKNHRFKLSKTLVLIAVFTSLGLLKNTTAQQSIVPSYHPVYDWLYTQRVNGFIPTYSFETLPHRRIMILNQLKSLKKLEAALSESDRNLLTDFLEEFDHTTSFKQINSSETMDLEIDSSNTETNKFYFYLAYKNRENLKKAIKERNEMHVFQVSDSNKTITLDLGLGIGTWIGNEDTSYTSVIRGNKQLTKNISPLFNFNIRVFGTFYKYLGFHYDHVNEYGYSDEAMIKYNKLLSNTWRSQYTPDKLSYHSEGYSTFGYKNVDFTIGRGLLKFGVGTDDNLAFSREAIAFNWLRLFYQNSWFTAIQLHGKLGWNPTTIKSTSDDITYTETRTSPQRWVVYQRFEFRPFKFMQLSIYEMLNYSNRSMDISYINISNRLFNMEKENFNLDNGWGGGDLIIRPYKGIELYGELLVDDNGRGMFKDVFGFKKRRQIINSKFARRLGLSLSNTRFGLFNIDYTRIEPEVYSHRDLLNAHVEKKTLLGSQIGPNADRWKINYRKYLSRRGLLNFNYFYIRKGLNVYENGEIVRNVGADPFISYLYKREFTEFLEGDLQRYSVASLEFRYEYIRSVQIKSRIQKQWVHEGNRTPNYWYFEMMLTIGMNY